MHTYGEPISGYKPAAALSGLLLLAGVGFATVQTAWADDDDWHTEAERPIEAQSKTGVDCERARPVVAVRPEHETLYGPVVTRPRVPAVGDSRTSYQIAAVAAQR